MSRDWLGLLGNKAKKKKGKNQSGMSPPVPGEKQVCLLSSSPGSSCSLSAKVAPVPRLAIQLLGPLEPWLLMPAPVIAGVSATPLRPECSWKVRASTGGCSDTSVDWLQLIQGDGVGKRLNTTGSKFPGSGKWGVTVVGLGALLAHR